MCIGRLVGHPAETSMFREYIFTSIWIVFLFAGEFRIEINS
ncbi:hypothetical protein VRK_38280 [Vibrio sp. MEBiC08052]|nr:hypothetical protein VRK_38280 [Vibrio sp. MEBiC08052]